MRNRLAMDSSNGPRRKLAPRVGNEKVSRRYLRCYLYDHRGDLLPPLMKSHKVSTALLPVMKIQGMPGYAKTLLAPSHESRRDAALKVLISAQERAASTWAPIYAVALVVCPDRMTSARQKRKNGDDVSLTMQNSYLGSFAAVGARNQIWAGDIVRETLSDAESYILSCISHIRKEPFERLIEMFESVDR